MTEAPPPTQQEPTDPRDLRILVEEMCEAVYEVVTLGEDTEYLRSCFEDAVKNAVADKELYGVR